MNLLFEPVQWAELSEKEPVHGNESDFASLFYIPNPTQYLNLTNLLTINCHGYVLF